VKKEILVKNFISMDEYNKKAEIFQLQIFKADIGQTFARIIP
jgi:hypothetical protein